VSKRKVGWLLLKDTVNSSIEYRVTGLAAEAAFFVLLSLPPLLLGLVGALGYVDSVIRTDTIAHLRENILTASATVLSDKGVNQLVRPLVDSVFHGRRPDLISLGFVIALWSGSRALNVFVDTITIMYGLGGHRGIVRTRALSFLLYVLGLITGVVTIPLVVAGPHLVDRALPERMDVLNELYWPIVFLLCICFLTTLYHVSVPVRTSWRYNLPGAVFTLFCWVVGSALLRLVLVGTAQGSTSIYGPLAAPIAILLWLYVLSIAVLIGAALNAAFDQVWPQKATTTARSELRKRLSLDAVLPWRQSAEDVDPD
jgi:membrane protein